MKSRTIRLIGYTVATYFGTVVLWGRVAEFIDKGWRTPDIFFCSSLMFLITFALFAFITEGLAQNAGTK